MKALITGVTGQDGSYLAEFLLEKGYEVHGIVRKASTFNTPRIDHLINSNLKDNQFKWYWGDISDSSAINYILRTVKPDEIYHLAAQSHVRVSFDLPEYTGDITGLGTVRLLEGIRENGMNTKFYQASSSELFGKVAETPQKETTPFYPRSPYAAAKVYAYWITQNYREAYNLYACNGILFNHESPRRGETFVTRKITMAVAMIKHGEQEKLYLGNVDAKRDWGYAPEYVECMWKMLQQEEPDDFVIATGETHTVREFAEEAFKHIGMDIQWEGKGVDEKGVDANSGKTIIEIDPHYFRPTEVDLLLGDPTKAEKKLGWKPKVTFKELAEIMVKADIKQFEEKRLPIIKHKKRKGN